MAARIDLIGLRFKNLVVLREAGAATKSGNVRWECLCDCGKVKVTSSRILRRGEIVSCGCKRGDALRGRTREKIPMTADRLRDLVSYDPNTGQFTRRVSAGTLNVGDVVGWSGKHGHIYAGIGGHRIALHRAAWLYVFGKWPDRDIDHIDGDPSNNRIANLRDVSKDINLQNQRRAKRTNKTGLIGAFVDSQRGNFQSSIQVSGKSISLGRFQTADQAHQAYVAAKRNLHPGNTL